MGFGDRFVGDNTGNALVKVQCSGCQRITTVKIPNGKSFEKWNEKTKCGDCGASRCWVEFES